LERAALVITAPRIRRRAALLGLAVAVAAAGCITTGSGRERAVIRAKDLVAPALVHIRPVKEIFTSGKREEVQVVGSGFIISPDGYVVTNEHVAGESKFVRCVLYNKNESEAKVVGVDPYTDIAVLKLDVGGEKLPFVRLGVSSRLKAGQTVLALGSPHGLARSVSAGIVSVTDRYLEDRGEEMVSPFNTWIQTDAAINPGNSGGALINTRGELVGINNLIISNTGSYAGLGFAIPIDVAQGVMDDIIKHGRVIHGYLGIRMDDLTPDKAEFFGVQRGEGVIITAVDKGSPAMKAGVKVNDIVTAVNGKEVKNLGELRRNVSAIHPGEKAGLQLLREGKSMSVMVTVDKRPDEPVEAVKPEEEKATPELALLLGVGLTDLNDEYRQKLELPDDVRGVLVTEVEAGSPAEEAGLGQRDVIVKFNLKPAGDLAAFKGLVKGMKGEKFMLTVYRGGAYLNIVIKS